MKKSNNGTKQVCRLRIARERGAKAESCRELQSNEMIAKEQHSDDAQREAKARL